MHKMVLEMTPEQKAKLEKYEKEKGVADAEQKLREKAEAKVRAKEEKLRTKADAKKKMSESQKLAKKCFEEM